MVVLAVSLAPLAACRTPGAGTGEPGQGPALQTALAETDSPRQPADETLLAWWSENHHRPAEYVLEKFRGHKWVFLGEYHRVRHDVQLISTLIPMLHAETPVRHLALEFLCEDRTDAANELISASQYDRRRAIDFFREQFVAWSYEEYLGIFEAAWRSNQLFAGQYGPFRLVGLHPCIDWEVINYGDDPDDVARERGKQSGYDEIMAGALESHLLRKNLPALVFTGIAHATAKFTEYWVGTDRPLPRMGNLVYREPYSSEMFFVSLHAPFYDSGTDSDIYPFDGRLDRLMAEFQQDIGFDVVDTPFETLLHENRSARSITAHEFGELFDGYILHRTPLREYVGVTCIEDWIIDEDQFRHYWRHIPNLEAAERFSGMSLDDFRAEFRAPRPDHGIEFRRRFRRLPELD
jgi:hypothetical protein